MSSILHIIESLPHPLTRLIVDDPVRPEIPVEFRVGDYSNIFVLTSESGEPQAVLCCAYREGVPSTVHELVTLPTLLPSVAVFYTIWSYRAGAGRSLIRLTRSWIEQNRDNITEFVTLSPPTEMARVFHLRNGARELRVNSDTINYQYP